MLCSTHLSPMQLEHVSARFSRALAAMPQSEHCDIVCVVAITA
jgi:hypothetical protein